MHIIYSTPDTLQEYNIKWDVLINWCKDALTCNYNVSNITATSMHTINSMQITVCNTQIMDSVKVCPTFVSIHKDPS